MQMTEQISAPSAAAITAPTTVADAARRWLAPGLLAGATFLGFEMLVGACSTSVWEFPQAIAQTIGIGSPTYDFNAVQLAAGIAIHLAFSIGLGVLFIAIARRLGLSGRRLMASAVLFMWIESATSIWLVLHTLFPATLPVLLGAAPFWASFVGRTGFGVVLALAYSRIR
jgi:hypothetical protein